MPCSPSAKRPAAAARRACSGLPRDSPRKTSSVSGVADARQHARGGLAQRAVGTEHHPDDVARAHVVADSTRPRSSSRSSCVAYDFAARRFNASLTSEVKRAIGPAKCNVYRSEATNVASYENVIVFVLMRSEETLPLNVPESPLRGLKS